MKKKQEMSPEEQGKIFARGVNPKTGEKIYAFTGVNPKTGEKIGDGEDTEG